MAEATRSSSNKEAAEIDLIRAEIAKLERESRPAPFAALTDVIKVVGSLILGLGGVTAAVTGYQMSEIKKERTELAFEKKQAELEALEAQYLQRKAAYDKLGTELAELDRSLQSRQNEFAETAASVQRIREQLVALRDEVSRRGQLSADASKRLELAIENADNVKTANESRKADFDQTKATVKRLTTNAKSLDALRLPQPKLESLRLKAAD
jgi:chromosome segregation ATPase